jgi:pantoate--beta-alanine ligase
MRVVKTVREIQAQADTARAAGARIALVPTMGALHMGHLSLIEEARRRADLVWVSIFVNPTQFNSRRDLEEYPREVEIDLARCREAGADAVFLPDADEMYPEGSQTWVEVTQLSVPLCGASRPGHFRGVTTVVTKLLLAAKPHVAVFGEKDFQQLAVIRRMVNDLCLDVEIVGAPIVREADGLAISSRNWHLDAEARGQATALSRALDAAERAAAAGERDAACLLRLAEAEIEKAARAEIDYVELRDPESLAPSPPRLAGSALLALAVWFRTEPGPTQAKVRLIDNRVLYVQHQQEDPQ